MNNIRFTKLANGLYQARDYRSGLTGLYNADGTYRSGDLRLNWAFVVRNINKG